MSFDRDSLITACRTHGRVIRVVVAEVKGSAPREVGAAMLVWSDGQSGTIGGGTLEFHAAQTARTLTEDHLSRHALGPDMGQCCGGAVTLLSEIYTEDRAHAVPDDLVARGPGPEPLAITRMTSQARNAQAQPTPCMVDGWFIEPVTRPTRRIWIWGAGHVGRAMVQVLRPLPGIDLTWVDTDQSRFPDPVPDGVTPVVAADPSALVPFAPRDAEHLIVTYSHTIDLSLCHELLQHGFSFVGLIGSATKWARFRKRLQSFGHAPGQIARIVCPIGRPDLGKHPQAIAIGVAAQLIDRADARHLKEDIA